jgi:hypothetical protein
MIHTAVRACQHAQLRASGAGGRGRRWSLKQKQSVGTNFTSIRRYLCSYVKLSLKLSDLNEIEFWSSAEEWRVEEKVQP